MDSVEKRKFSLLLGRRTRQTIRTTRILDKALSLVSACYSVELFTCTNTANLSFRTDCGKRDPSQANDHCFSFSLVKSRLVSFPRIVYTCHSVRQLTKHTNRGNATTVTRQTSAKCTGLWSFVKYSSRGNSMTIVCLVLPTTLFVKHTSRGRAAWRWKHSVGLLVHK